MARRMTAQGYARLQARRAEEDRALFGTPMTEEEKDAAEVAAVNSYCEAQAEAERNPFGQW